MAKTTHKLEVNKVNLYREVMNNTVDALEIIREAISNSVDASANEISIDLKVKHGRFNLTILDNGTGMDLSGLEAFFGASISVKDSNKVIGHKGLGSKTTFSADHIRIRTAREGYHRVAVMDKPRETLQNDQLPTYETEDARDGERLEGSQYTRLELRGVHFNSLPAHATAEKILLKLRDYIAWNTAAGTFKNAHSHHQHIRDTVVNIDVVPKIMLSVTDNDGNNEEKEFVGLHPFPDTNANPQEGTEEHGVKRRSRNYVQPFQANWSMTREVDGKPVLLSWECSGVVAGKDQREKMAVFKQGETHKSRFGLRLCKDFIGVESVKSEPFLGPYYFWSHVLLNSQNFILTADRNNVANMDSLEAQEVLKSFKDYWTEQVVPTYLKKLKDLNDSEEALIAARRKAHEMIEIKAGYNGQPGLDSPELSLLECKPSNEAGTSTALAMMLQSGAFEDGLKPIAKIGNFIDKATDLICVNESGEPLLVELEHKLQSLFNHKHPIESFDVVVCWELGNAEHGDSFKTTFTTGGEKTVTLKWAESSSSWALHWGTGQCKPVIVLSALIENAKTNQRNR